MKTHKQGRLVRVSKGMPCQKKKNLLHLAEDNNRDSQMNFLWRSSSKILALQQRRPVLRLPCLRWQHHQKQGHQK